MFWRPRSLRLRYTLRALLVFITLFMLWGGYHTNRSWKERAAVELLQRHHASLTYGPDRPGSDFASYVVFAYEKLAQFIWREPFVTRAKISAPLEPDVVEALCALPHAKSVGVSPNYPTEKERDRQATERSFSPRVATPRGAFAQILGRLQLQQFSCNAWYLSEEDCRAIGSHPTLQFVSLNLSHCSEEGFAEILKAPKMRYFSFTYSNVTGEKLARESGSASLETITCDYTPAGHEFAAYVSRCPNVRKLECRGRLITDEFIAQLASHPSLVELAIDESSVTDASIPVLETLSALQTVSLRRTAVSHTAAQRFQKARPRVSVSFQER
jgi:hypothetical protein